MLGLLLLTLAPPALAQDAPAWMVVGTELVYDVDYEGSRYQFLVTLEDVGEDLSFSWEMTEPVGTSGWVTTSAAALQGARAQHNRFSAGELSLTEATSVWLSDAVFAEIEGGGDAAVVLEGEEVVLHPGEADPFPVGVMAEDLAVVPLYAESDGGAHKYWILDDPACPLILKLDLGWTLRLATIRPGKTLAEKQAEARDRLIATFPAPPTEVGGKRCRKAVKKAAKAKPRTYARTSGAGEPLSTEVVVAEALDRDQLAQTTTITPADGRVVSGEDHLQCHGDTLWLNTSYFSDDGTPVTINPPLPMHPLPLEPGAEWTWKGLWTFGEEELVVEAAYSVGDPMSVTVPAGTFEVLPVEWTVDLGEGPWLTRDWVLPKRVDGLVRRETDADVLELVE